MSLNITIVIVLMLLAFAGGFFAGGKWKAKLMRQAIDLKLSPKAKTDAIRKRL